MANARRSNGEGSIIQRADRRWQGSLQVDGRRAVVYGKTQKEVADKLRALGRARLPDAKTTLDILFEQWLETSSLKARTQADYHQTYRLYIRDALGSKRIAKIKPVAVERLLADLRKRGLTRAQGKAYALLHRLFAVAVRWQLLDSNPCDFVSKPSYHAPERQLWTPFELNVFLTGAQDHRFYGLWLLAISTGCRLGELLALEWADVVGDTLHVSKAVARIGGQYVISRPKTHAGNRVISLPYQAHEWLNAQRAKATGALVFPSADGSYQHPSVVTHDLRKECGRLGVRALTMHDLRHLHASLLLENGAAIPTVSKRLGHSSANITLQVYAHVVGNADKEAARALEVALR